MGAFDTPIGRRSALGILGSGVAAGLVACGSGPPTPKSMSVPSSVSGDAVTALLAAVPKRTIKDLNAKRLADGLTTPTNRWFSGLVFGDDPQAVFPMPIGFAVAETGFEIWLPQVSANGTSIIGARSGDAWQVTVEGTLYGLVGASSVDGTSV